jgi:hypothetical protein
MNENISPNIWGSNIWKMIFEVVAVYPVSPSQQDINGMKYFFLSLKSILPCESCRHSYTQFIEQPTTDINNSNTFASKINLITFVFNLRNKVNNKVGLEYGITMKYFKLKLEHMVCFSGNHYEFVANTIVECPFIPTNLEQKVASFTRNRKKMIANYVDGYTNQIVAVLKQFLANPEFSKNSKPFEQFINRNKRCHELITKIYSNMSFSNWDMEKSFKHDLEHHVNLFYLGSTIIPNILLEKLVK